MTIPILLTLAIALGGVGVFLAMPRGRAHAGKAALVVLAAAAALLLLLLMDQATGGRGAESTGWFITLSVIALVGGVRVVTHPRPVYSALYFILVVVAVTGMLVLMQAEFLAAALLIIYAGAILVTYVFVIMLAQQGGEAPYDREAREPFIATVAGFVLLGTIAAQLFGRAAPGMMAVSEAASTQTPGNVVAVGTHLLTRYAVGVELAGVLLLASMVGAIAIAKRRPEDVVEEEA